MDFMSSEKGKQMTIQNGFKFIVSTKSCKNIGVLSLKIFKNI